MDWRMPAEWEPHAATWIAWPHNTEDWPGKFEPIPWVYAEITRALALSEPVHILCHDKAVERQARRCLEMYGVTENFETHIVKNDRSWLRDTGPIGVVNGRGEAAWRCWEFNGWAKYLNNTYDRLVNRRIGDLSGVGHCPVWDTDKYDHRVVLEGGGIDVNGSGSLLVTEEWLLSDVQVRNHGYTREDYERVFEKFLGATNIIWLGQGCEGDDTHGHVDDIARFVNKTRVVLAYEDDPAQENHRRSKDNLQRLQSARDEMGGRLSVVRLPFPRRMEFKGLDGMQRVPASYANFYIANKSVLVPTFNDPNDRVALDILAKVFPTRTIQPINCVDLVWGLGTLHCLTQQQPVGERVRK